MIAREWSIFGFITYKVSLPITRKTGPVLRITHYVQKNNVLFLSLSYIKEKLSYKRNIYDLLKSNKEHIK